MIGLKIGGVPEHFNLPWRLAIESGEFKEKALDLHWSDMSGGTGQMIRGLETRSIDVAILLTEGISKAILQGLDAKIIQVFVTSPLRWGVHVPQQSNIEVIKQLYNQIFAISREGSGSQLMAYVIADQYGWDLSTLKFNVVGDIYGGLWALQNNAAQAFLWEKFTTQPFVEQRKCRLIDEVVTPWPCFVVAARNEVIQMYSTELQVMCELVNQKAQQIKISSDAVDMISWRYNLDKYHVAQWLDQTEWNYTGNSYHESFGNMILYLQKIGLITDEQSSNWKTKLFN